MIVGRGREGAGRWREARFLVSQASDEEFLACYCHHGMRPAAISACGISRATRSGPPGRDDASEVGM
jgi:hypothetical protein